MDKVCVKIITHHIPKCAPEAGCSKKRADQDQGKGPDWWRTTEGFGHHSVING